MGSGTAGIRTTTHMGSQCVQGEDFSRCAMPPGRSFYLKTDLQKGKETDRDSHVCFLLIDSPVVTMVSAGTYERINRRSI